MYLLYFVYQLVHYEEKKRKKRFTCTWRHFTVMHSKYFVYWYILYEEKKKRKSQKRDYLFIGKFRRNPFDIFCSWYISPQVSRFISQHTRAKRLKQHKHVLGEYMYKWTEKDKISARSFVALLCYFFFFKCKWYEVITCFDYGCVSKLCTYFSYPAVVYFLHVFGYWRCVGHRYHFISFHLSWPF